MQEAGRAGGSSSLVPTRRLFYGLIPKVKADRMKGESNLHIEIDIDDQALVGVVHLDLVRADRQPQLLGTLLQIGRNLVFAVLVVGAKQGSLVDGILKLEVGEQNRDNTNSGIGHQH